jgi:hypothetical protein
MGQWQSQPVCTTPSCIHAASFVLKNLAPDWKKMDPCTDFDKSEQPSAHSPMTTLALTSHQWFATAPSNTKARTEAL